jgi:hypothetical protein
MNEPIRSRTATDVSLPLCLPQTEVPRTTAQRWSHTIVFWAPVWLTMIVLAQIATLGLGPALAKRRGLAASEQELAQRLEREQNEQAQLQRWQHAQNDPIYLERERRLLRTGEEPQTSK